MLQPFVTMLVAFVALHTALDWAQAPAPSQPSSANQVMVFERGCATCHDNPGPESRAPGREALRQLTPERVFQALTTGPMAVNAQGWSDEQKRAMAELVTGKPFGGEAARTARMASSMKNRCASPLTLNNPWTRPRWNGWSPDPTTGWRFQPPEVAGMTADRLPQLKLKWAFAMPGAASAAWAQPTVVGGALFIGSDNGFVYALDARTGCVHWSYEALGQIRSAVVIGELKGMPGVRYAAYFGDYRGNAYAIDAESGKQLWVKRVDPHEGAKITGAPVIDPSGNRVYVPVASWEEIPAPVLTYKCCTFQGSVVALDTKTGNQIWKTYTTPERPQPFRKNSAGTLVYGPAGAAVWNAPTIDVKRRILYVGTGNVYVVAPNGETDDAIMAFDLNTGKRLWWTHMGQSDPHPGGCGQTPAERRLNCPGFVNGRDDDASGAPVLFTQPDGRSIVLEGQESGRITAVDPDKRGAVVWVAQAGDDIGAPNAGFGGAFDGELYYKPVAFQDQSGAIAAIKIATGERVWYTKIPRAAGCPEVGGGRGGPGGGGAGGGGGGAAGGGGQGPALLACNTGNWAGASAISGAVFTGSKNGTLRAFSSRDGHVIWEYATNREFDTVNGVPGQGGGIGGPGPTIVDGMLFTGSGYAILSGAPGNVLLAFGLE